MGAVQPSFFPDEKIAPKPYVPDPHHVRNRIQSMLNKMRTDAAWPWNSSTVCFYRETVWPYPYTKLPDAAEAARWRADIDAEAARLDAAQARRAV